MISQVDRRYFIKTVKKLKKDSSYELSACCPCCGDTKNRLHLVYVTQGDFSYVKCFNSGCQLEESTSMIHFLTVANGDVQGYKRETLSDKIEYIKNESNNLNNILAKVKASKTPRTLETEIPKILLDKFKKCKDDKDCLEYVRKRGIEPFDDWMFSTDKFFTHNKKSLYLKDYLIIPVYNKIGKYKGFYSRSIKEKRFSTFLLPDAEKIWIKDSRKDPTHIFEGIFDALSTSTLNPAAMLGAGVSQEYEESLSKDTTFVFDNDIPGVKKSIEYSKKGFNIFVWPEVPYKDTNEMLVAGHSKEQITKMIQENTHKGVKAEILLRMKHK